MSDTEDLERRVATLEAQATATAAHVADAHERASGADRDVAELGIKTRVTSDLIQALHVTQSETTRRLSSLELQVRAQFGALRSEMQTGFAMTGAGYAAIAERLDRLIGEG